MAVADSIIFAVVAVVTAARRHVHPGRSYGHGRALDRWGVSTRSARLVRPAYALFYATAQPSQRRSRKPIGGRPGGRSPLFTARSRSLWCPWSAPRCRTAPGAMISTERRVPCATDDVGNALNSTVPGDDACASCHDAAGEPCVTSFKRVRLRVVTPATDSPTRLHRGSPAASS